MCSQVEILLPSSGTEYNFPRTSSRRNRMTCAPTHKSAKTKSSCESRCCIVQPCYAPCPPRPAVPYTAELEGFAAMGVVDSTVMTEARERVRVA